MRRESGRWPSIASRLQQTKAAGLGGQSFQRSGRGLVFIAKKYFGYFCMESGRGLVDYVLSGIAEEVFVTCFDAWITHLQRVVRTGRVL